MVLPGRKPFRSAPSARRETEDMALEIPDARWTNGIHEEGAIEKKVSRFAARLGDNETSVASSTVEGPIVGRCGWIMIRTDGIARAQPLPFQRAF